MDVRFLSSVSEGRRNFFLALLAGFILATMALNASTVFSENRSNLTEIEFFSNGERIGSLEAEIADSREEKAQGLMYREELPVDRGMLFVWKSEGNRSFWMKNTLIPLDMVFITGDRKVADIFEAHPQPGANHSELRRYTSREPVRYVLEANASFVEKTGLEPGDSVSFRLE